jgi:hypothetical protein
VTVPPRLTDVLPIVTDELVRAEFGRLVKVLVDPLIDLLVNVSVVALPTKVSVEVGKVKTPPLLMEEMTGRVKVLFVRVCVAVLVVIVSPPTVPLTDADKVVKAPELAVVAPIGVLLIEPPV